MRRMNPASCGAAVLAAACLLLAAGIAQAHQQKAAITRVLFNERTGNIEVMHRFYLHDAEHAVRKIFGKDADIIGAEATRRRFGAYVGERFELRADGRALALAPVGFEIDGRFFWVYQETAIPEELEVLSVQHQGLRDVWSAQSNLVNVERGGKVRSLRFEGQARLLEIEARLPAEPRGGFSSDDCAAEQVE